MGPLQGRKMNKILIVLLSSMLQPLSDVFSFVARRPPHVACSFSLCATVRTDDVQGNKEWFPAWCIKYGMQPCKLASGKAAISQVMKLSYSLNFKIADSRLPDQSQASPRAHAQRSLLIAMKTRGTIPWFDGKFTKTIPYFQAFSYWSRLNFSDEDLIWSLSSSTFNLHLSFWPFFALSSVV